MFNKIIKRSQRKAAKSDPHGRRSVSGATDAAPPNSPQIAAAAAAERPPLAAIENLPMFHDVAAVERQNLFTMKLQICCVQYDSSSDAAAKERQTKRHTLIELSDFIQSNPGRITEVNQEELVTMISTNIFRCSLPFPHETTGCEIIEPEDEDPFHDPNWVHLQPVYELLLRYISVSDTKTAKRYLDHRFIVNLLDLFDSKNANEREYLKTILHRVYGKFMVHRPFIRKSINNIFYRFIHETGRHSGIAELLEMIGSIINGFALPIKEEHKAFLEQALIPLHKAKALAMYHSQLSYCIVQFVEKDCRLADTVVMGLLKYWPIMNSHKEVLFLGEVEEVLEATNVVEFHRCMVPLFRQISRSIKSSHFKVAERALSLLNNEHIVNLIAQNRYIILPIIFEALEENVESHWNQSVQYSTLNVRRIFMDMDPELLEECGRQCEERKASSKEVEERRELIWQRLAAAAAEGG